MLLLVLRVDRETFASVTFATNYIITSSLFFLATCFYYQHHITKYRSQKLQFTTSHYIAYNLFRTVTFSQYDQENFTKEATFITGSAFSALNKKDTKHMTPEVDVKCELCAQYSVSHDFPGNFQNCFLVEVCSTHIQ